MAPTYWARLVNSTRFCALRARLKKIHTFLRTSVSAGSVLEMWAIFDRFALSCTGRRGEAHLSPAAHDHSSEVDDYWLLLGAPSSRCLTFSGNIYGGVGRLCVPRPQTNTLGLDEWPRWLSIYAFMCFEDLKYARLGADGIPPRFKGSTRQGRGHQGVCVAPWSN